MLPLLGEMELADLVLVMSYDHVFGCKTVIHIPKVERSNLDVKTRQSIFIGYDQDEFGYRLYDPVKRKLMRSRNDPVPLGRLPYLIQDHVQDDNIYDKQGIGDIDAPLAILLRRSTRD
ncbi:hypothetical protein SASPL_123463 [Salvia splendens]|uniref:Retroviral polymerase SH3-like domain-containing protein n=1 Tax=Salvia splendens TaxID=180675 RepID=A0A8X8XR83_SALSN|nr:hypothetical protein SASPL_123463 [Salvia splendens]